MTVSPVLFESKKLTLFVVTRLLLNVQLIQRMSVITVVKKFYYVVTNALKCVALSVILKGVNQLLSLILFVAIK
jgi:hypothetical protein